MIDTDKHNPVLYSASRSKETGKYSVARGFDVFV
jgi:hypothetical protein